MDGRESEEMFASECAALAKQIIFEIERKADVAAGQIATERLLRQPNLDFTAEKKMVKKGLQTYIRIQIDQYYEGLVTA